VFGQKSPKAKKQQQKQNFLKQTKSFYCEPNRKSATKMREIVSGMDMAC
jgi:hypothetical protein